MPHAVEVGVDEHIKAKDFDGCKENLCFWHIKGIYQSIC
jgi:hypothetical protein